MMIEKVMLSIIFKPSLEEKFISELLIDTGEHFILVTEKQEKI